MESNQHCCEDVVDSIVERFSSTLVLIELRDFLFDCRRFKSSLVQFIGSAIPAWPDAAVDQPRRVFEIRACPVSETSQANGNMMGGK